MAPGLFATDPSEPLDVLVRDAPDAPAPGGARVQRFELTSRGDRVPGRCA